ncbi:MAG: hypothetical protein ACE5IY_16000 [bacterium]
MKTEFLDTPRVFTVKGFDIYDRGKIHLEPQEMVTFRTASGRECDFTATSWGFYLAPSLNSRLRKQGFKTALVTNEHNQLFVNAVEEDKIEAFESYLQANQNKIICWLDEWFGKE